MGVRVGGQQKTLFSILLGLSDNLLTLQQLWRSTCACCIIQVCINVPERSKSCRVGFKVYYYDIFKKFDNANLKQ